MLPNLDSPTEPDAFIKLPAPPQEQHLLPSGHFDDLPIASDRLCFTELYTLWNQAKNSTIDQQVFKHCDIAVPLSGPFISDTDDTTTSSAYFLRLCKGSFEPPYTMLVRDEYRFVAGLLEYKFEQRVGKGCLLLGQTGIGKTMFGQFFLIHRILNARNTYVRMSTGFYCFTTRGFKFCKTEDAFTTYLVNEHLDKRPAILLYDSNQRCDVPQPKSHEFWTVLITSPATHRYKEFQKQTGTTTIWMAPWSWEEVYCTGQAMYSRGHEALWEIFIKIGPTIRPAYKAASGLLDDLWSENKKSVDIGLNKMNISGSALLRKALEAVHTGTGSAEDTDSFPSAIFILKPLEEDETRREYTVDTVTRAMADRVLQELEAAVESEAAALDFLFSSTSATAPSRGNLFEARYLRFLRKKLQSGHLHYTPRFLLPIADPKAAPKESHFEITLGPNTTVYDSNVSDFAFQTSSSPFVLIPTKSNQPTWDFLGHSSDYILIGQASTHSRHSVIIAGLDDIKALTANTSFADHRFWKIVFIVPSAVEPWWKNAMPITKGKAKKYQDRSTAEYEDIEQYVVGVEFV